MDSEQRGQLIETIRQRYLQGEAPSLVSTLMVGPFSCSPWNDQTMVSEGTVMTTTLLNRQEQDKQGASPTPMDVSELTGSPSENSRKSSTESATSSTEEPKDTEVVGTTEPQLDNQDTQEFDSDLDRTVPYDILDEDEDEPVAISSSPP